MNFALFLFAFITAVIFAIWGIAYFLPLVAGVPAFVVVVIITMLVLYPLADD